MNLDGTSTDVYAGGFSLSVPAGATDLWDGGNGQPSDRAFVATMTAVSDILPPAVPENIAVISGDARISISWDAVSDAVSYNVKRSQATGGGYAIISEPTAPEYIDLDVTNGTIYYYVVSAVGPGGESGNSAEIGAVPSVAIAADEYLFSGHSVVNGSSLSLTISNSVPGHLYRVWASDSLVPLDWYPASDVLDGNAATLEISIPIDSAQSNCFYSLDVQRR